MTYWDVFVARLKAPKFDWSDLNREVTRENIQFLTSSWLDREAFDIIKRRVDGGSVLYRELDWGSHVIPASRSEILAMMASWTAGEKLPDPPDEDHKPRQRRAECLAIVQQLPDDGEYLLVTEEF
jgi:hypothetical protein